MRHNNVGAKYRDRGGMHAQQRVQGTCTWPALTTPPAPLAGPGDGTAGAQRWTPQALMDGWDGRGSSAAVPTVHTALALSASAFCSASALPVQPSPAQSSSASIKSIFTDCGAAPAPYINKPHRPPTRPTWCLASALDPSSLLCQIVARLRCRAYSRRTRRSSAASFNHA